MGSWGRRLHRTVFSSLHALGSQRGGPSMKEPARTGAMVVKRAPRARPLRFHLLALTLGALVPVVAFSVLLVYRVTGQERAEAEQRLVERARLLADAVDRELSATMRTLEALAAAEHLDEAGRLETFYDEAQRVVATQPSWLKLRLMAPDGTLVMDSGKNLEPPEGLVDVDGFDRVVRANEPSVGDLVRGPRGDLAFAVRVPVRRAGTVVYVLSAVLSTDSIYRVIVGRGLDEGEWARSVLDAQGTVVARTRDHTRWVGKPAWTNVATGMSDMPHGLFEAETLEGERVLLGYARTGLGGWTTAVAVKRDVLYESLHQSLIAVLSLGGTLLLLSCAAALLLGRRLSRAVADATRGAQALASGEPPTILPSSVLELESLRGTLEQSARLLAERQRERDEHLARANAARAEAEAASRAKDEFLAMLGHELRNPLSPIVTALELIKFKERPLGREHAVIDRQVRHLIRLVDDLLDIARITRGTVELKRVLVDMSAVVARAVEMASPLYEAKNHQLTIDVMRGLVVDGDADRLAQVVANLLTNAARYTPNGGHIHVRGVREGKEIVLSVKDDGQGIAPELLPKVFDLFVQGPRKIDRREGGLGIGLTLVRRLSEAHGGRVEARSEGLGKGSTFIVRLPAASTSTGSIVQSVESPEHKFRPMRLLVVDDNEDLAETLEIAFSRAGHEVALASDGPGALHVLESFRPDVAFLDLGLPVMDGYELAGQIRERLGENAPCLVAVTGYGQPEDRERTRAAGFVRHMVKPIDADSLLVTADELVRARKPAAVSAVQ